MNDEEESLLGFSESFMFWSRIKSARSEEDFELFGEDMLIKDVEDKEQAKSKCSDYFLLDTLLPDLQTKELEVILVDLQIKELLAFIFDVNSSSIHLIWGFYFLKFLLST